MNMSFSHLLCSAWWKSLENLLRCVLNCVMVVKDQIKRENTMYKCVSGFEILRGAMKVVVSANIVEINRVGGDLHRSYSIM